MKINRKTFLFLTEIILAILASVSFFFGFQILASDFMDFSHLYRTFPSILSYFSPLYLLFVLHLLLHHEKTQKRLQIAKINGLVMVSLGLFLTIMDAVYLGIGFYPLNGLINPIFPVDIIVTAVLLAIIGFLLFYYAKKGKTEEANELTEATRKCKWEATKKILHSIFFPFYTLIALYELGGLLLGFGFAAYRSPLFSYGIPAYLAMFSLSVFLLLREIFLLYPLKSAMTKRILAISLSVLGLLLGCLPLFMLIPAPTYVETCFHPYYPLDFMGSLRISIYLWSIPNILAPIFFFLHSEMKVLSCPKA